MIMQKKGKENLPSLYKFKTAFKCDNLYFWNLRNTESNLDAKHSSFNMEDVIWRI
ncbi:hypothetical protein Avbf_00924 [Armadillidium vulgare]|nr:hypothetical protein Avbf_00924 [Armadillidium vulgare]